MSDQPPSDATIEEVLAAPAAGRTPPPYRCRGEHGSRNVRSIGPLMVEICADSKCAKVFAVCMHPKCSWDETQTTLTCDFCGVDAT